MIKPGISRRNVVRVLGVLGLMGCSFVAWIGLSAATEGPQIPPWVECDDIEIDDPQRQFAPPCRVSVSDLPDELPVLDVNGEVVGTVDARLLFRPPAPSADLHDKSGDEFHPEDPPLEVFGPSDEVVGIIDNTGFVPEEEIP
jgi:hypothetical protein